MMEVLKVSSGFSKEKYLSEYESLDFLHGALNSFAFLKGSPCIQNIQKHAVDICQHIKVKSDFYPEGQNLDGVVFWNITDKLEVLIVNSDGSIAGTCGNALRCLGQLLLSLNHWDGKQAFTVNRMTFAQVSAIVLHDEELNFLSTEEVFATLYDANPMDHKASNVTVGLGQEVKVNQLEVPESLKFRDLEAIFFVELANPHIVLQKKSWSHTSLDEIFKIAKLLQEQPESIAKGIPESNIGFLSTEGSSQDLHELKVYERGAGYTPACGSGAAAARVSLEHAGIASKNSVKPTQFKMPGGTISISSLENNHKERLLSGPAKQLEFV